jgi:ribonuclease HI
MKREKKLRIFVSGAARGNPAHGACAAVFFCSDGSVLREEGKYLGRCANDAAEYSALRLALQAAERIGAEELEVFSDSEQLVKLYGCGACVKQEALADILADIWASAARFKGISLTCVPREKNKEAQKLVSRLLADARDAAPALARSLARENSARSRRKPQ